MVHLAYWRQAVFGIHGPWAGDRERNAKNPAPLLLFTAIRSLLSQSLRELPQNAVHSSHDFSCSLYGLRTCNSDLPTGPHLHSGARVFQVEVGHAANLRLVHDMPSPLLRECLQPHRKAEICNRALFYQSETFALGIWIATVPRLSIEQLSFPLVGGLGWLVIGDSFPFTLYKNHPQTHQLEDLNNCSQVPDKQRKPGFP